MSIMGDSDWLSQTMLQWLSRSPTAWKIDSEVGDAQRDILGSGPAWITYLRYTLAYDSAWFKQNLNMDVSQEEAESLFAMDNPKNVEKLSTLGAAASHLQVHEAHFPAIFDLA
jgi:hypothetical protein